MSIRKPPNRSIFGVNGQDVPALAILMYPEPVVRAWQGLMAGARAELGGSGGVGVGFIGSPEWALGGAALMSILGAASANAKAKKAIALLTQAEKKRVEMIDSGVLIPIASISNIDLPDPGSWIGKQEGYAEVNMKDISFLSRSTFLRSHGLSKDDVQGGKVSVSATERFVIFDTEFVTARTDEGEVAVRWSSVASYRIAA